MGTLYCDGGANDGTYLSNTITVSLNTPYDCPHTWTPASNPHLWVGVIANGSDYKMKFWDDNPTNYPDYSATATATANFSGSPLEFQITTDSNGNVTNVSPDPNGFDGPQNLVIYTNGNPTHGVKFKFVPSNSGPTVTSITRNESNNLITVLHTGTLSSSDVTHKISNVTTSITNLQTITNGSTFTASGSNGTHVITISDKILSYFINNTTGRTAFQTSSNLTVTFPTTDAAWLSNFNTYANTTQTFVRYLSNKTAIRLATDSSLNYFVWITFNLNYNATQNGYSVLTQIYDYRSSYNYGSTLQYVYPEANFESNGSADTLLTLPTNEIVSTFNWNFAAIQTPGSTTSNGGGKPDRYPIIMTNLFNRNRSIYSIGMTHKDTWDLFL